MISGRIAATEEATIRARGFRPSADAFSLAHDEHRGGTVVERARVAGGDGPIGPEDRLQRGELLHRRAGARPVVGGHLGPVGRGDRDDLAVEVPAVASGDRARLRDDRPLVLRLP
jgi:hypothetical protein